MTRSASAMEDELKPCPFCGSDKATLYSVEIRGQHNGALIECQGCSVEIVSTTDEAVVAHWQSRAMPAATAGAALRSEVMAFARLMETVLRQNDHKGGWKECEPDWLANRVLEEAAELKEAADAGAIHSPPDKDEREAIAREAADVANFAMMIADVCCALDPYKAALHPAAAQEDASYELPSYELDDPDMPREP